MGAGVHAALTRASVREMPLLRHQQGPRASRRVRPGTGYTEGRPVGALREGGEVHTAPQGDRVAWGGRGSRSGGAGPLLEQNEQQQHDRAGGHRNSPGHAGCNRGPSHVDRERTDEPVNLRTWGAREEEGIRATLTRNPRSQPHGAAVQLGPGPATCRGRPTSGGAATTPRRSNPSFGRILHPSPNGGEKPRLTRDHWERSNRWQPPSAAQAAGSATRTGP